MSKRFAVNLPNPKRVLTFLWRFQGKGKGKGKGLGKGSGLGSYRSSIPTQPQFVLRPLVRTGT